MRIQTWTAQSIKAHQSDIATRIRELVPLKDSTLKQAHARGLGFATEAALVSALKASQILSARAFSDVDFVARIAEIDNFDAAETVAEILGNVTLDISITKRSNRRQRADCYSDVAYDVVVTLGGLTPEEAARDIVFHLPEFGQSVDMEPYRVDSAHDCRADADYRKTHLGAGQLPLVAKLVEGRWHGALYVYAPEHQADDSRCIRSVKAGLARAILARLPTRVRCSIFRPDGYQYGAWRVELRLTAALQRFISDCSLQFDIPELPKRHILMAPAFRFGPRAGRFVDGIWKADLYSNGIEEARNPTSLDAVKRALLGCVDEMALIAGHGVEGRITPVHNDDEMMIGTVAFRGGWHEAWSRARTSRKPGNAHSFLGRFRSMSEAESAIRGRSPSVM